MPGYSTLDLGRVTHGSGCGVPLKHHLGRGFGPGSFSPALPGKGLSHWISKMCQPDFFEPETQRAFYRDYARASKWE